MDRTILVVSASSLLLVDFAVKGTVLLVLAAIAAMILRRDSAATRHFVWLLAIVTMLAVPVLSALLPQWRVLPVWPGVSRESVVGNTIPSTIPGTADGAVESAPNATPVKAEPPSATVHQPVAEWQEPRHVLVSPEITPESAVRIWINALPLVWAIGFSVFILRLVAAQLMLWYSECRGSVISSPTLPEKATSDPIVTALEAACLQLGIRRPVTLLIHPDKTIPVVWGILRCRLLLPAAARHWSGDKLQSVLLHELAHIKRRDTMAQLLTQIACALHWFNPLVWFAAWRLGVEGEWACDDLVLASGVRPSAYARHLLEIVTGLSPARWLQSCGLAMARKSSLEGRLAAVLSENLNRRGVSVALAAIAFTIGVGIAVPIAMLRAAEQKPAAPVPQPELKPEAQAKNEAQKPNDGAKLPGRLFVNAGLRTTKNEKRFSQSAIAIDPNTGTWTRLQNLNESGFAVPLSPVRVSPDGRTMLFMRDKDIWKCDATTGKNAARVFPNAQPKAWAPDGKEFIAVVTKDATRPDKTENWRVSADGQNQSLLPLPVGEVIEDWSPDGRWFVGWSHADGQLYIMKLDGRDRRRLTNTDSNASRNEHPRFSPDGRRIVYLQTLYQGDDGARDSRFSLRTINSDGTDNREILGEKAVGPGKATRTAPMGAKWSPDGKHLAVVLFDHDRGSGILAINGNWRLAIIDADGGKLRELQLEGVLTTVLPWDGPEWRPAVAGGAGAKLPDDALWNTKVLFEKIPVTMTNWSEEKNGLRIGMRVLADEGWRIGGKVKIELWLHNPGAKDISFRAAPGRSDFGLVVVAKDANGKDHWAESANVSIYAYPTACTLPAGQVAKVKAFALSFDAPDNKERAWSAPKFRKLDPGQYKLRCVWSDPHPIVSSAGDWTGDLTTSEIDFTLASLDPPKPDAPKPSTATPK